MFVVKNYIREHIGPGTFKRIAALTDLQQRKPGSLDANPDVLGDPVGGHHEEPRDARAIFPRCLPYRNQQIIGTRHLLPAASGR